MVIATAISNKQSFVTRAGGAQKQHINDERIGNSNSGIFPSNHQLLVTKRQQLQRCVELTAVNMLPRRSVMLVKEAVNRGFLSVEASTASYATRRRQSRDTNTALGKSDYAHAKGLRFVCYLKCYLN